MGSDTPCSVWTSGRTLSGNPRAGVTETARFDHERKTAMDSTTNSFGQVLLWSFWFFIWIAALAV